MLHYLGTLVATTITPLPKVHSEVIVTQMRTIRNKDCVRLESSRLWRRLKNASRCLAIEQWNISVTA